MNYTFDLHLHSCLSPYGGEDMTPKGIADLCAALGYDIVALTDYNSCGNSAAFQAAADANEEDAQGNAFHDDILQPLSQRCTAGRKTGGKTGGCPFEQKSDSGTRQNRCGIQDRSS